MFRITEGLLKEKFSTIKEAAEKLAVSEIRVRKLCYEGRFKGAFSFGGVWMIPKESVEGFERRPRGRKSAEVI